MTYVLFRGEKVLSIAATRLKWEQFVTARGLLSSFHPRCE